MSERPLCSLPLALLLASCARPAPPTRLCDDAGCIPFDDQRIATLPRMETRFDGRVRLLAVEVPAAPQLGDRLSFVAYWLVERDLAGSVPRVFVHAFVDGGELNVAQADHDLPQGRDAVPGDVLVDRFAVVVPRAAAGHVTVAAGLYDGDRRWPTAPRAPDDRTALVDFAGPAVSADVLAADGAIVVDGVLSEPDWQRAAPLPLVDFRGRDQPQLLSTTAQLLWSADALYLAFVADDPDPFSPYGQRDDPLYESEAYEIFIDADGDAAATDGEYVELQSNHADVHFDSAFAGGRRQHMQVGYDVPFETKTVVVGRTLTQEWRIPVAALLGVPAGEPRPGASWRINLFRLERRRRGERVVGSEASAWSAPLSNDFHNVARFGRVVFR